jgi:CheY-like chemotaxis protein
MSGGLLPILICDDDPDDRLLASDALFESRIANPVLEATDGEQLLHRLRGTGPFVQDGPLRPAVILLDLNMPRLDGREVLLRLAVDEQLCAIPVVVLTTSKADEDRLRSISGGAIAFMTKPVDFDSLILMMLQLPDLVSEVKVGHQ